MAPHFHLLFRSMVSSAFVGAGGSHSSMLFTLRRLEPRSFTMEYHRKLRSCRWCEHQCSASTVRTMRVWTLRYHQLIPPSAHWERRIRILCSREQDMDFLDSRQE